MHEIKVRRSGDSETSRNVPMASGSRVSQHKKRKAKKRPKRFLKSAISLLIVIVASTFLSTVMMHATSGAPFSETLTGLVFRGEENSRCPEGMVYVSSGNGSFCIDTFTASAGEKCPHLEPGSQSETKENLSASECEPVSRSNAMPWRNISQTQAQEACRKAGKFLPDNEKWFSAARGTPSGGSWGLDDCNLDNNWSDSPGPTGSGEKCLSYAGSFDQVGNTWEWVNDTVRDGMIDGHTLPESGYITSVDAEGLILETDPNESDENYDGDWLWVDPEGTRGVMRGGFFGSGTDGGVYSLHAEMAPDFAGRAVGFRCAAEVTR